MFVCINNCYAKENRESTEGYLSRKVEKRHGKFGKTDLNNLSISKSTKRVTELGVRKDKRSLLAFDTTTLSHPITGFKDDSACVTTKTADRITEDG